MKRLDMLQQHSSEVGLLDEERKQLRESLLAYMEKTPVQAIPDTYAPVQSHYFSKGFVVAVLAGLIVASSGVAFAASRAVPGDMLYPIKVGINEKVMGYMAISNERKATVEAHLAAERLEEAQQLHAEAKLDDTTAQHLRTNFNAHVSAFETRVEKIKKVDVEQAATVEANFKSSLSNYSTVLPTVAPEISASLSNKKDIPKDLKEEKKDEIKEAQGVTELFTTPTATASSTLKVKAKINVLQ
jgi:hypothetical protein